MVNQCLSERLTVTYSEKESAFDESEPIIGVYYKDGPLQKSVIPSILTEVY